jgi:nucleoside-diphosphate-sugar epimerase
MKVFVAGGTGTIGIPLIRALVSAGQEVTGLTRSVGKQDNLRALRAIQAVANALDPDALAAVFQATKPEAVIHQLTGLPKDGVRRPAISLRPTGCASMARRIC